MKTKVKENQKGITLIALVITIIVLLILASVSIAMLIGDNGILTRVHYAKIENENKQNIERIKLETLGSWDESGKYNKELAEKNLKENLGAKVEKNEENDTLKVIYGNQEFLIDQNGNTMEIKVPGDLEIGDSVEYIPKTQSYIWKAKYSGAEFDTTLENINENYKIEKWKVLNINNNGTINLVAEKTTTGKVTLGYDEGYNNGVKLLNEACNELYGNTELGIVGRSIKIEDIEAKMTKDTLESIKNTGTNSDVLLGEKIGNPYSIENSKYPNIYPLENLSVIGGIENSKGLKVSEQQEYISKEEIMNNASIQPYQTYYYRNQNQVETFFEGEGTGVNNKIYNILMPNGKSTNYWLASRSVHVGKEWCNFGMRCVFWGMNMTVQSTSKKIDEQKQSYSIFPIITINFNQLTGNKTDGWKINVE